MKKKRVMLEMPLNDQAMKIVKAWQGMRKNQWVFYHPETGHQFKDLWLGLQKACKKAGVENVTWHTFRHTFATRLNRRGVDIVTVKELLGHSDIKMTIRYAHSNRDEKIRAVKCLGRVVTK